MDLQPQRLPEANMGMRVERLLAGTIALLMLPGCTWIFGNIQRREFSSVDPGYCSGDKLLNSPFAGGSGTSADPYTLCTPAQFKAVGQDSSRWHASFEMRANLDLTGLSLSPIGTAATPFTGTFAGGNFQLSNVSMTTSSNLHFGIFGYVRSASISNLTISQPNITSSAATGAVGGAIGTLELLPVISNLHVTGGSISGNGVTAAGGIIGQYCYDVSGGCIFGGTGLTGTVSQVSNSATVSLNTLGAGLSVGGILGQLLGGCLRIQNARNSGAISGGEQVGGIVGFANLVVTGTCPDTFVGVTNAGTVSCPTSSCQIGGIIGRASLPSSFAFLQSATNSGSVNATQGSVGGIIGTGLRGFVSNSVNNGSLTVSADFSNVGGIFGSCTAGNCRTEQSFSSGSLSATAGAGNDICGGISGTTRGDTILNSFAISTINCANSLSRIGRIHGFNNAAGGAVTVTNSWFNSSSTCTNPSTGSCGTVSGTGVDLLVTPAYFGSELNPPLDLWNFASIWRMGSSLPELR